MKVHGILNKNFKILLHLYRHEFDYSCLCVPLIQSLPLRIVYFFIALDAKFKEQFFVPYFIPMHDRMKKEFSLVLTIILGGFFFNF
jgi:hypothetical protein